MKKLKKNDCVHYIHRDLDQSEALANILKQFIECDTKKVQLNKKLINFLEKFYCEENGFTESVINLQRAIRIDNICILNSK